MLSKEKIDTVILACAVALDTVAREHDLFTVEDIAPIMGTLALTLLETNHEVIREDRQQAFREHLIAVVEGFADKQQLH
jgi:hypothetical protein